MRALIGSVLTAAVLAAALAGPAAAEGRRCPGTIAFSGSTIAVVTLRGVTCAQAKRVARGYARFSPPAPWKCALAHAPFDRIAGRIVGFSCGYGPGPGNLRLRRHAFLGTIARR
jgi:hypothetical protein